MHPNPPDHLPYHEDYMAELRGNFLNIPETFHHFARELSMPREDHAPPDGRSRYSHWRLEDWHEIHPEALGCASSVELWPEGWKRITENPPATIGAAATFHRDDRDSRQTIRLIYLTTEAIQTYLHLWGLRQEAPLAVVVQNHGKGGFWTQLDGNCLLYACAPVLPRFLDVGDINSDPWPNYHQVSREVLDENSMHHSRRALYECTLPDRINPDSPLHQWNGTSPKIEEEGYAGSQSLKLAPSKPANSHRQ